MSRADPSLTLGPSGPSEAIHGSWLRGKEPGSLGFVCVGGQPSVCTSQVCHGRAQVWPPCLVVTVGGLSGMGGL